MKHSTRWPALTTIIRLSSVQYSIWIDTHLCTSKLNALDYTFHFTGTASSCFTCTSCVQMCCWLPDAFQTLQGWVLQSTSTCWLHEWGMELPILSTELLRDLWLCLPTHWSAAGPTCGGQCRLKYLWCGSAIEWQWHTHLVFLSLRCLQIYREVTGALIIVMGHTNRTNIQFWPKHITQLLFWVSSTVTWVLGCRGGEWGGSSCLIIGRGVDLNSKYAKVGWR